MLQLYCLSVSQSFKSPLNQISIVADSCLPSQPSHPSHPFTPAAPVVTIILVYIFTDFYTGIATSSFPHHVCKTLSDESSSTGKLRILGRQCDVTNL